jgi:hypothetical protein
MLRMVLEVGNKKDNSIASRLQQPIVGRTNVAKVSTVGDYFDMFILAGDVFQYIKAFISRCIVDKNMLVLVIV